ncbi:MAG: YdcF family protein [Cyanobacteria bacterium P01_G01_bin.49]
MSFLFLSKVLPLLIYPIGLSSLLLIIALILFWKRPNLTPFPVALSLIILLLFSNAWVSSSLVESLENQRKAPTIIPQADAIVILGGATYSPDPPRPMVEVNEHGDRLFYGAKLYRDRKAPIIIVSGGRISWSGQSRPESEDMAQLLQMLGVPSSNIIQESNSLNTYQNAVNVKQILDELNIQRILLVTSAFHQPRACLIFEKLGVNVIAAPTDYWVTQEDESAEKGNFEGFILGLLPDAHRLSRTTVALKEYLGMLIYRLRGWI